MSSEDESQLILTQENNDFTVIDIKQPLISIQPKASNEDIKDKKEKDMKDETKEKHEAFNCLPTTLYLFDKYCFIDEKRTHQMALEFSEIERWQMCVKQCICLNCYIPAYIFDTITCPIRFWKYVYIDCGFN